MVSDDALRAQAITFAKKQKSVIAREVANKAIFKPEEKPVSIFMAGSPGAGKTEFAKRLKEHFEKEGARKVLRVDGDELRSRIPGYTGKNSDPFQDAVAILVERIHEFLVYDKQSFILDGVFSKFSKAKQDIAYSLMKGRSVVIFYLYQDPRVAWKFVIARERAAGRGLSKRLFVELFLQAQETLERLRVEFGNRITVYLVQKNYEDDSVKNVLELKKDSPRISDIVGEHFESYTLEKLL